MVKLKSYSHGLVAALLKIASKLDIPEIINKYTDSPRHYTLEDLRNKIDFILIKFIDFNIISAV